MILIVKHWEIHSQMTVSHYFKTDSSRHSHLELACSYFAFSICFCIPKCHFIYILDSAFHFHGHLIFILPHHKKYYYEFAVKLTLKWERKTNDKYLWYFFTHLSLNRVLSYLLVVTSNFTLLKKQLISIFLACYLNFLRSQNWT